LANSQLVRLEIDLPLTATISPDIERIDAEKRIRMNVRNSKPTSGSFCLLQDMRDPISEKSH